MVTFDVCWEDEDGTSGRVRNVTLPALPRRGDALDLENLSDAALEEAFQGGGPYDVHWLVVLRVVHRPSYEYSRALVEVHVHPPGADMCSACASGRAVRQTLPDRAFG